jgi:hypothetical protein
MQAILLNVSVISGFFPLIAAAFNYRDLDKLGKILSLYFLLSVWGVKNNMPSIHLFIIVSIVFIGSFYYLAFFNKVLKKAVLILSTITLIMVLFFARNIWVYPSASNAISGLLFIIFSVLYFYQLLTRQEFIHIEKQGNFWINAGILFYYAVNMFLFMLLPKIISKNLEEYYIIHSITNIIANLLYSIGLLCKPQTTTA